MVVKQVSESNSFYGWDLIVFLKGNKKPLIALFGGLLGYFISGDETISFFSGLLFVSIISVLEFYFSKVRLN